jgi:integrase
VSAELIEGEFPDRGLKFPKTREKPRFHTWDEITDKIKAGGLTDEDQQDLWDCLFLSNDEITELLGYVKSNARHTLIYPMFVMAAHTGARRSEMLRSQLIDIEKGFLNIREKKRVRGQLSTRRVPMSAQLAGALANWKTNHPGGQFTFCLEDREFPEPRFNAGS